MRPSATVMCRAKSLVKVLPVARVGGDGGNHEGPGVVAAVVHHVRVAELLDLGVGHRLGRSQDRLGAESGQGFDELVRVLGGRRVDVADGDARLTVLQVEAAQGEFDLVAVGRALVANPAWAESVRTGRTHELRGFDAAMLDTLD